MVAVEGAEAGRESLSMWRRKKEMGKEGLMVVREMKRLHRSDGGGGGRLEGFLRTRVSRLLKSDLTSVLMELQRQDLVFLSMKDCDMDAGTAQDKIGLVLRSLCVGEIMQIPSVHLCGLYTCLGSWEVIKGDRVYN
ncbi:Pentatricopeptide repeat-containing protein [Acorus calamus]|uniref:Pentatricopeptide repeat-containing protein n=1 Tax=Acorus calamus TaxID=4465 RepID=A0AAV9CF42_ACOCL|nr:Pentatricopeptide repeat-containing protein [Acorus calamus]